MVPKVLVWAIGKNKLLLTNLKKNAEEYVLEREISSVLS